MYILSLDNNRIFWILSIALLVLVFLFLLGYWIGQDHSDTGLQSSIRHSNRSVDEHLGSLKRMLDGRRAAVPSASLAGGRSAAMPQSRAGKTAALQDGKKLVGALGLKADSLSPEEKRELTMLQKDAVRPLVKKTVVPIKRVAARRRSARKIARQTRRVRRGDSVYSPSGKYAIQVASLGSSGGASRLRGRLSSRSFRAYISRATVNGKRYYRIKVGRFSSYSKARQVLASLQRTSYGRGSYIVTN